MKISQVSFMLRLKAAIYQSKQVMVSVVEDKTDADDWIISGQSLLAHCKRMRYVDKDEFKSVAQTESAVLDQPLKANSLVCKDLLEPVVL